MNSHSKDTNRIPKWLKERTNSEKHYMVIAIVLGILALGLLIALCVVLHKTIQDDTDDICMSPGCVQAAAKTLSYMDTEANPCEDFYQFACGAFEKNTLIPEDKNSISTFHNIGDQVREQLKDIISNLKPNDTKPNRLIKKFYNLCMNTTAIEEDGLKTVKTVLRDLGGWPLLEGANWNEATFDWKRTVYKCRKLGFSHSYFLYVGIETDYKNSTKRTISVGEGGLGLTREYLIKGFEDKLVKAYYKYMVDVAVIFGANRGSAEKELKETLEFQMELAKITLPKEKKRNATALYNPMTIDDLQNQFPYLNWLEYIQHVLDIPDIDIGYDEVVIVSVPQYFSSLEELLRKTPKRVLSNLIMIRSVLASINYLTEELRNKQTEYIKTISGKSEREPRWKECTDFASGVFYLASGALYAKKYFNIEAKHHAEEMVNNILTEFKEILNNVDWMDEKTKQNAIEKANTIVAYIGYPEELLDEKKVEKFYDPVDESANHYLLGIRDFSLFMTDYYHKKLRQPINKTEWIEHAFPTIVNAFYSSSENSIQFPAAILQGVFYSDDRPRYMNYGAIGYVIGHEITHGFDDQGRQYDKDGNLNNWWDEATKEAFLKKAQCIIEQYGNYTVPEINANLNGVNTQGENIADNGGILEAYRAYNNWVKRNGPEQQLPGLPYTQLQMFWISAAQTWCVKTRKEVLDLQVTTGYHSPGRFRVLGPFGNTESFGNDFNCPLGSKMNPVDKCKVW
ncbi:hypothetical protein RN001_008071 [Aquatica leii]|uniref:Uncharacterized protein n=1 Tax=Aquatica leii TaxID=1421715 RepID=A0AAN7P3S4_9COLE|nr:hypothetical protein RN001_008071 [Aquatica leii]